MKRSPRRAALAVSVVTLVAIGPVTAALTASATPTNNSTQNNFASHTARSASAAADKSAPLGSVNATATATGLRSPLYSHQGEDVEVEAPYSVSQLGGGGVGHAVTSIIWPGATGAHGGSTLGLLGVKGIPTSLLNSLNDPEVAEAPTVTGATTSSKSEPGLTMEAIAKPTHVEATSAFGATSIKGLGEMFGTVSTTTKIVQTKTKAIIDAKSEISDISIGGVLTIQSVISSAHATSNGHHATGTSQTTIAGAKVAGINVSIDQKGIQLASKGILPPAVLKTLNNTVNTALKQIGLKIFIAKGTKKIHGPSVDLDSGDLIIMLNKLGLKSNVNDTGTLLQLGGATISAVASPGYVAPTTTTQVTQSPQPTTSTPPTTVGSGGSPPVSTGGGSIPPAPQVSTAPPPQIQPQLASNPLSLPGVLSKWWIVLMLALGGVFAFGLKRLPDEVLKANGPACTIEEST